MCSVVVCTARHDWQVSIHHQQINVPSFYHIATSLQYSMYFSLQLHEEDDALNMWMFDAVENNGKYTRYVPQKWSYYAGGRR